MTIDEVYAYYMASQKHLENMFRINAICMVNVLGEVFGNSKTPITETAKTFDEFSKAMGGVINA